MAEALAVGVATGGAGACERQSRGAKYAQTVGVPGAARVAHA